MNDGTLGYGGSSFTVNGGTFTVGGTFTSTSDSVYAENGGKVQLASLTEDSHGNGVTLYVYDATSSIEIGTKGGVAAGTITIDSGQTVTEAGTFYTSSGTIVDNGVLNVGAGQSLNVEGTLDVDGSATIRANATLNQDRRDHRRRHGDHRRRREAEADLQLERIGRHDRVFRRGRTAGDQQL